MEKVTMERQERQDCTEAPTTSEGQSSGFDTMLELRINLFILM